jgi:guanylate kinase
MLNAKKKLFCIIGETASGKDTLVERLISSNPELYKPVCSYTTREKRDGETDGKEHYFITKSEFDNIKREAGENVVAYTKIANEKGEGYEYMATLKEVMDANIYIIDPLGLKYLKDRFSDKLDVIAIYIYAPFVQRKKRAEKSRSDFNTKFEKRVNAERGQFDHFYRHRKFDYIIYNFDGLSKESFQTFQTIVNYELFERDLFSEFTSVLDDEYTKEDLIIALNYLKTVTEFYTSQLSDDGLMIRDANKNYKLIRNIILGRLR